MMRVLVVDDDADIRGVLRFILEDAGYEVAEAPDGESALHELVISERRMVVLLDNLMPNVDGADVLQCADEDVPTLALARHAYVLMTASPQKLSPVIREHLAHLHAPVLSKPFEIEVMLHVVADAAREIGA